MQTSAYLDAGSEVSRPLPAPPADSLTEAGNRITALFAEHLDVVDYLGRALVKGGTVGTVIFDGLYGISAAQRDHFTEQQLARPDLDPTWAALNPLLLRFSAVILRTHIERHLPEPFDTPAQLQRWDAAVTALIREGQMRHQPEPVGTPTASLRAPHN